MLEVFRARDQRKEEVKEATLDKKTNQTIFGIAGKKTQTSSVVAEGWGETNQLTSVCQVSIIEEGYDLKLARPDFKNPDICKKECSLHQQHVCINVLCL